MGIKVVMITGDNEKTAKAIGREAGVDDVVAGVLPEGKAEEIERLQQYGKVAMVGDGINDAPALTRVSSSFRNFLTSSLRRARKNWSGMVVFSSF